MPEAFERGGGGGWVGARGGGRQAHSTPAAKWGKALIIKRREQRAEMRERQRRARAKHITPQQITIRYYYIYGAPQRARNCADLIATRAWHNARNAPIRFVGEVARASDFSPFYHSRRLIDDSIGASIAHNESWTSPAAIGNDVVQETPL